MDELRLTVGGWVLLIGSMTFVWALAGWCYYKVLTAPSKTEE